MKKYKKASDIKVGVVGYGGAFEMGRLHLNLMKKAGMTPVAVAEIDPKRLKKATEDFPGIKTYSSLGRMLQNCDVDLVTMVTPHNTHYPLAMQALKAGKHVVLEKPMAITTQQCDGMIAMAKKKGVVLSTFHNRHWDGWIMNAVKLVRQGAIGEPYRVEAHLSTYGKLNTWWRSSKKTSGGVLYDWGVHFLEYTLQIIDSDIDEVSGYAKKGFWAKQSLYKGDTIEDEGFAVIRFTDGRWATLMYSNTDSNPKKGILEITGTKGSIVLEWDTYWLYQVEDGVTKITKGRHPPDQSWRYYQNVADHLAKGTKLIITGEWARRPIHILHLADMSAKAGKAMKAWHH